MKKIIPIFLILISLLVTGCDNGILTDVVNSKEMQNITYQQLLGIEKVGGVNKSLYFLTEKSLSRYNGSEREVLIEKDSDCQPQKGWFVEDKNTIVLHNVDGSFMFYDYNTNEIIKKGFRPAELKENDHMTLIGNGYAVIKKADGSYKYGKLELDISAPKNPSFTIPSLKNINSLTGYGLSSVHTIWGSQEKDKMVVSFVSEAGNYKNFYFNGTTVKDLNIKEQIAAFAEGKDNDHLWILLTDGTLYESKLNDENTKVKLGSYGSFSEEAFLYKKGDCLICKPNRESIKIINIENGESKGDSKSKTDGFAQHLKPEVMIVDALDIQSTHKVFIATAKSGMLTATIPAKPWVDDSSSTAFEEYTF